MAVIDWQTPLALISNDSSALAKTLGEAVRVYGQIYDAAGKPDVLGRESSVHSSWRLAADAVAAQRARISAAANAPGANTGTIALNGTASVYIQPPPEPRFFVDAYYEKLPYVIIKDSRGNTIGYAPCTPGSGLNWTSSAAWSVQQMLRDAVDELNAYLATR